MIEFRRYSEGEEASTEALNSSQSSTMSSDSCPSFSRLSFDVSELLPPATMYSPENLMLKPHRSCESSWQAIRSAAFRRNSISRGGGGLGFRDFSLVRQIGSGDIGKVYLCRLRNGDVEEAGGEADRRFYAMKVVDREVLALKKKIQRAETEKKIMKMLDHPFLPTLYAQFEASHFSCVVMEYCSGGDLHSLRHKQPHKCFSLNSARFYAAEVLVALEYLHMLGIIYRDLKPENVLVRSDGHIMLTDFDLSLCSDAIPAVQSPELSPDPSLSPAGTTTRTRTRTRTPRTLTPFSCLPGGFCRSKKIETLNSTRMFVAEPVTARSCSFVGTHEYVAPEVASGMSHGNAVDWWALGIFIYEMIYGFTPFFGTTNESTLSNIVKSPLAFPYAPTSGREMLARDLIKGLLNKDPDSRLGSKRGAADVKTHPFFKDLNFALIRSVTPPEIGRQKAMTLRSHGTRATTPFDLF